MYIYLCKGKFIALCCAYWLVWFSFFSKVLKNKASSFCSKELSQCIIQLEISTWVTQAPNIPALPAPVSGNVPPCNFFLQLEHFCIFSLGYINYFWAIKVIFQGKLSTVVSKDPPGKAHTALASSCQNFLYRQLQDLHHLRQNNFIYEFGLTGRWILRFFSAIPFLYLMGMEAFFETTNICTGFCLSSNWTNWKVLFITCLLIVSQFYC